MSVAKELIFTGRVLDGTEARSVGLVNDVIDQNDDGDAAFHRSMEIAQLIVPNVGIFVLFGVLECNIDQELADAAACAPGSRCVCNHQMPALFCMK